MDKNIETMTAQELKRAADELLAADAAKSAPKKKSTRRTKAAEEKPVEEAAEAKALRISSPSLWKRRRRPARSPRRR